MNQWVHKVRHKLIQRGLTSLWSALEWLLLMFTISLPATYLEWFTKKWTDTLGVSAYSTAPTLQVQPVAKPETPLQNIPVENVNRTQCIVHVYSAKVAVGYPPLKGQRKPTKVDTGTMQTIFVQTCCLLLHWQSHWVHDEKVYWNNSQILNLGWIKIKGICISQQLNIVIMSANF